MSVVLLYLSHLLFPLRLIQTFINSLVIWVPYTLQVDLMYMSPWAGDGVAASHANDAVPSTAFRYSCPIRYMHLHFFQLHRPALHVIPIRH